MKTAASSDPLVAILYLLLRDRVTPGALEMILEDIEKNGEKNGGGGYRFTNGYLAAYAKDIVARIEGLRR